MALALFFFRKSFFKISCLILAKSFSVGISAFFATAFSGLKTADMFLIASAFQIEIWLDESSYYLAKTSKVFFSLNTSKTTFTVKHLTNTLLVLDIILLI
jgi:hypothetical protein